MESTTATPAAPAAPAAPTMAQGGAMPTSQAAVAQAHGTAPQVTMSAAEMAEGGETNSGSEHKTEWGQWIAIGLISLTLVSLILQIAVHRRNLKKVDADDEALRKDVRELKMNLKKSMGEKYETLD